MWMHVFEEYLLFMNKEGKDMSSDFPHKVFLLKGIFDNCTSVETFELRCTTDNLQALCDLTSRVVDNGAADRHFPQWTYLVTQFQLFVLEVQGKTQGKSDMAEEDLYTRADEKRTRLARDGLNAGLTAHLGRLRLGAPGVDDRDNRPLDKYFELNGFDSETARLIRNHLGVMKAHALRHVSASDMEGLRAHLSPENMAKLVSLVRRYKASVATA
jgi:hypothetical protein